VPSHTKACCKSYGFERNKFDDRQIKVIKNRNLSILFDERQINVYNKGEDESF
jgi:hypothetical protein